MPNSNYIPPLPPQMDTVPRTTEIHSHVLHDDYFWFKEKENPKVLPHLKSENEYTENILAPHKELRKTLLEELQSRIVEEDESVPAKKDNYYYYHRTRSGEEYPTYYRKLGSLEAKEEVLLNLNELAKKSDSSHETNNLSLGVFEVSPDHKVLAYSIDLTGDEKYLLQFKCLDSGELLGPAIENTYTCLEWGNDSRTIYFTRLNDNLRPDKVYKHCLGDRLDQLGVVFTEPDSTFFVHLRKSLSTEFIFITCNGAITSECHTLIADHPDSVPKLLVARQKGVEYYPYHGSNGVYYVLTNQNAKNFKILTAPVKMASQKDFTQWKEFLPHTESNYLVDLTLFHDHMVIQQRNDGLESFRAIDLHSRTDKLIPLPEENCFIDSSTNLEFKSNNFRFVFSCLTTPHSVIEYDFYQNKTKVLKEKQIPGYDKQLYATERRFAKSHDGALVPISLFYKKDFPMDGHNPCYLYGYGSYGHSMSPGFWPNALSLVNRGFVVAVAHIRGGSEMGRAWYENGKFLKKMNTFLDFIGVAEYLIAEKFTKKGSIVICGGSAGGLLVGASLNLRSDLFGGAIAHVPFVDLINTMLDESLPLTTLEYDEWGDPRQKEYFDYMLSYSPYDNIEQKDYPSIFVTAGLNDPRVTYWEPAKWVAKLRARKTNASTVLLYTHLDAGHQGASGRYKSLQDTALEYTFILGFLSGQI